MTIPALPGLVTERKNLEHARVKRRHPLLQLRPEYQDPPLQNAQGWGTRKLNAIAFTKCMAGRKGGPALHALITRWRNTLNKKARPGNGAGFFLSVESLKTGQRG